MRACLAIPLLAACNSAPTCETGDETHQTWVSFQTDSEEQIESLLLVPTKPSQTSFQDLVPLSEPYRVLSPVEAEEEVALQPYEGPFFESDDSELMLFLVAEFLDMDGNGAHDPGEPILGLSSTLLAYFNRVGCGDWGGKFHRGWNAVQLRDSGPAPFNLSAVALPRNLETNRDLELKLAMEASPDSRVVVVPEAAWNNQLDPTPLVDAPTAESLNLVLPEDIPEEHLQSTDVEGSQYSDWFYGVEVPLWVENQEAFESYGNDALVLPFCSAQQEAVRIGHYPEADKLEEAFHLVANNRTPGWGLYLEDVSGSWRPADPSLLSALTTRGCGP